MTLTWIKRIFTPVALVFILSLAWQSRQVLLQVTAQARVDYLLYAIFAWALLYLLSPIFLQILLTPFSSFPGFRSALYININRLPARYIPGGIWHTVARAVDLRDHGISKRLLTMVFVLENALALGVALFVGGTILGLHQEAGILPIITLSTATASLLGLALLPVFVNRIILTQGQSLSWFCYTQALLLILLYWCGAAAVFVLYISAFPDATGLEHPLEIAGTYLFSWGVGFIAIFAPQGIGVFEFVAGDLLKSPYGLASITVLLAGFRLVILAADIVVWLIAKVLNRKNY